MAPILAITGATGQQGAATVNALLKHHAGRFHIRCVVRNPDALRGKFPEGSIEIVKGDQMDKASLVSAFQGAEKVFLVTAVTHDNVDREEVMGRNTIDAAIDAGVKYLLFTSVGGLTDEFCGIAYWNTKIRIGRYLKQVAPAKGLKYGILKPCMFYDNWNGTLGMITAQSNEMVNAYPGKVRMRFIAVRDIGWFAAYMLVNSERYESKELEIASEILSYDEAAAAFARFTKKPFKHRRADPSQLPTRPGGTKPAPGSSKNLIFSAEPEALAKIHPGITKIDTWIAEEWNGRHEYLKARM